MGYDLHITRRSSWTDQTGPVISDVEWSNAIASDSDLSSLNYSPGEITAKNPDKPLIAKMVRIAAALSAQVQGDDGEIYRQDGTSFEPEPAAPPPAASGGFLSRIKALLRPQPGASASPYTGPEFRVGQRVKNPWGVKGVITHVDRKANGGLGSVIVRMDDGNEHHMAYKASGLTILSDDNKPASNR